MSGHCLVVVLCVGEECASYPVKRPDQSPLKSSVIFGLTDSFPCIEVLICCKYYGSQTLRPRTSCDLRLEAQIGTPSRWREGYFKSHPDVLAQGSLEDDE